MILSELSSLSNHSNQKSSSSKSGLELTYSFDWKLNHNVSTWFVRIESHRAICFTVFAILSNIESSLILPSHIIYIVIIEVTQNYHQFQVFMNALNTLGLTFLRVIIQRLRRFCYHLFLRSFRFSISLQNSTPQTSSIFNFQALSGWSILILKGSRI